MNVEFDIAIVGAGPAGSSLAIRLTEAGSHVVLLEKARFPRPKLCGEFISPECVRHFDRLGIAAPIQRDGQTIERTIFYAQGGRSVAVESDWFGGGRCAIGLSRAAMDLALLERAREIGVEVIEGATVTGPIMIDDRVAGLDYRSGNNAHKVMTKLVVDATGRGRSVVRHFESVPQKKASHVAFKAHLRGAQIEEGVCEIFSYPGGYGGCNAVEDGLANLCFIVSAGSVKRYGSDPTTVMENVVLRNTRAREVLAGAVAARDWLAVPITNFGRRTLSPANGLLTVGDAASFIDPFTGSGILMALESAEIAADSITRGLDSGFSVVRSEYERAYAAAFGRRLKVSSFLRRAAFIPTLADATISLLSLSSTLRRSLARSTRGQKVDSLQPSD